MSIVVVHSLLHTVKVTKMFGLVEKEKKRKSIKFGGPHAFKRSHERTMVSHLINSHHNISPNPNNNKKSPVIKAQLISAVGSSFVSQIFFVFSKSPSPLGSPRRRALPSVGKVLNSISPFNLSVRWFWSRRACITLFSFSIDFESDWESLYLDPRI